MTLHECIEEIDAIEPNAYQAAQKSKWILQCEKAIATGVFLLDADDCTNTNAIYDEYLAYVPLLTPEPFDRLYPAYLHAMIHYANGEYERYQNDMALYNALYGDFARWFAAKYEPALTMRKTEVRIHGTGELSQYLPMPPDCVIGRVGAAWNVGTSSTRMEIEYVWTEGEGHPIELIISEADTKRHGEIAIHTGRGGNAFAYITAPSECYLWFNLYQYGWPDKYGRRP